MLTLVGCAAVTARISAPATPLAVATTAARASAAPARASAASAPGTSIFGLTLDNESLTVTAAGLYLTWYRVRPSGSVTGEVLARADAGTGLIVAQRKFGSGLLGAPLLADGSLWVTDSTAGDGAPGRESLLRLNPATLAVTGQLTVGGGDYGSNDSGLRGQIAAAGGSIWMDGGGLLVRVDPRSMRQDLSIAFPGAGNSSLGASPDGTVLIVAETRNGIGTVQRRDPVTGALLASSASNGVITPAIADVTTSGVWLAVPTGMMGYVERVRTGSLSPVQSTDVAGTNGIRVRYGDGALWVTDPVGGAARNYCADPATGRVRARLPLPDLGQDQLLAVGPRVLYYAAFTSSANGWRIATAAVPAACD